MLEEGTVIKLGNKYEYVVVFSTMYNESNYVFVTNIEMPEDSSFYKVGNNGKLEYIEDMNTVFALLDLYNKKENVVNE